MKVLKEWHYRRKGWIKLSHLDSGTTARIMANTEGARYVGTHLHVHQTETEKIAFEIERPGWYWKESAFDGIWVKPMPLVIIVKE